MIRLTPIESSMISHVGHDESREVLRVRFVKGSEFDYEGVPKEAFDALMKAKSVGKHFHRFIKPKYDATKRE